MGQRPSVGAVAQMSDSKLLPRDCDVGGNWGVEKDVFNGHLSGYLSQLNVFHGTHKMPSSKWPNSTKA